MTPKNQKPSIIIAFTFGLFILAQFSSCIVSLKGNDQTNSKVLTQTQMHEDVAYFIQSVELTNPHLEVRKTVTGLDILEELEQLKLNIDSTDQTGFAFLLNQALNTCQDGHTSTLWKSEYFQDENYYQDLEDLALGEIDSTGPVETEKHNQLIDSFFEKYKFRLKLKYIDGEYYTVAPFMYKDKRFEAGLKLVQYNETDIHDLIAGLFNDLNLRWDFMYQKFYNERFYRSYSVLKRENMSLTFVDSNDVSFTQYFNLVDSLKYDNVIPRKSNEKKVYYFSNYNTLYLRVPCMCIGDTSFYGDTIKQLAESKLIEKIIVDIRGNGGGSDDVGLNIIKAIIADTIKTDIKLYANPADQIITYFERNKDSIELVKPTFMNGKEYLNLYSATKTINPDSNSINYKGKIYILQDENIFSAAGTFAAIAYYSENVINVGNATGRILGLGTDPGVYMLPNSKLMYRIEPLIDFSGANTPMEVFHDHVEMPLKLTIKDYLARINYKDDLLSEAFLLNHDPAVKAIINLE